VEIGDVRRGTRGVVDQVDFLRHVRIFLSNTFAREKGGDSRCHENT
jgi:hypothetical protein